MRDDTYDGHLFLEDDEGGCVFCHRSQDQHRNNNNNNNTTSAAASLFQQQQSSSSRVGQAENEGIMLTRATARSNKSNPSRSFAGKKKAKTKVRNNALITFGNGQNGKLGHGSEDSIKIPQTVSGLLEKDVIQVAVGQQHVVVLTSDGSVVTWGQGGRGQLGHGNSGYQWDPTDIEALKSEQISIVAAGHFHTAALTVDGTLYTWGDNTYGQLGQGDRVNRDKPTLVQLFEFKPAIFVACGKGHTAVVTEDNEVYTWGDNSRGQLGHGDNLPCLAPKRVQGLDDKHIRQVHCYDGFTIATTIPYIAVNADVGTGSLAVDQTRDMSHIDSKIRVLDNKLATQRKTAETSRKAIQKMLQDRSRTEESSQEMESSQKKLVKQNLELFMEISQLQKRIKEKAQQKNDLVEETEGLVSNPDMLSELGSKGIKQIATGKRHMLILMSNREVFAVGDNRKGQLGFGIKEKRILDPERIRLLADKGVKEVSCGDFHSACVTFTGDVWCWGDGSSGQLGLGKKDKRLQPSKVRGLLEHERIERVVCGAKFTVVLTGRGELFMWGIGDFAALNANMRNKLDVGATVPTIVGSLKRLADDLKSAKESRDGPGAGDQNKNQIKPITRKDLKQLLDLGVAVESVERMYPEVQADPEAAMFLSKEINKNLHRQKAFLASEVVRVKKEAQEQLDNFVMDQEQAMITAEREEAKNVNQESHKLSLTIKERENFKSQLVQDISATQDRLRSLKRQAKDNESATEQAMTQSKAIDQGPLVRARQDMTVRLTMKLREQESTLEKAQKNLGVVSKDLDNLHGNRKKLVVSGKVLNEEEEFNEYEGVKKTILEAHALWKEIQDTSLPALNREIGDGKPVSVLELLEKSNNLLDELHQRTQKLDSEEICQLETVTRLQNMLYDNINLRKRSNQFAYSLLLNTQKHLEEEANARKSTNPLDVFT